ncbi:MAG TPA: hypothetical protein VK783_07815 [Bacteroidia bacterium]|nr:hypothetical protein [Bacteroidia bacterium]
MKTLLLAFAMLTTTTGFTNYVRPSQYVYIDSSDAKEPYYHKGSDCKDIKKGDKVKKVTLTEAVNKYHLKPCPECYKPEGK